MAKRVVFSALTQAPYVRPFTADLQWAGGFALSQKQKNVAALHSAYAAVYPADTVLEISRASAEDCGRACSAFNLRLFVPSLGRKAALENVFQSSKVFAHGGPYPDLLDTDPVSAKKDPRLINGGELHGFRFEGTDYPLTPKTAFYDFIYIRALRENPALADAISAYDAFSDIAFDPERSINCQAHAAALYTSLRRLGQLEQTERFEDFVALIAPEQAAAKAAAPAAGTDAAPKIDAPLRPGDEVVHPRFGVGKVAAAEDGAITVVFASAGEKRMQETWLRANCTLNGG